MGKDIDLKLEDKLWEIERKISALEETEKARLDQLSVLFRKVSTIEKYLGIKIDLQTFGVNKEEK